MFCKKVSHSQQENTCARISSLTKLQATHVEVKAPVPESVCNIIKKETLAQVFSCEFHEISKSSFFYRTPLVAASAVM